MEQLQFVLEHPWNKTLSLWGDFQQFPGGKAIESSRILERAMGIEPTSEAWEGSSVLGIVTSWLKFFRRFIRYISIC